MSPNPFDQACRYLAKLDPVAFLAWLLHRLAARFRGWLDTRTLPFPGEPDRTCDTVAALVVEAEPDVFWAMPIEFQTRPGNDLFGRLLEYLARVWRELRPAENIPDARYAVVAAVVNLTGIGRTSRTMELDQAGLRTCLQVAERNFSEEDAAATLSDIAAGYCGRCILPFVPLMRGGAEPNIIHEWMKLAEAESDPSRRGDYGGLALVFAELANCRLTWKEALVGWNVEVSQQVLEWQAKARVEGEARGFARGRTEGKVEGKAEGKAEAILDLLALRFSAPIPEELAALIRKTTNLTQLNRWLAAAAKSNTLVDFHALVSQPPELNGY